MGKGQEKPATSRSTRGSRIFMRKEDPGRSGRIVPHVGVPRAFLPPFLGGKRVELAPKRFAPFIPGGHDDRTILPPEGDDGLAAEIIGELGLVFNVLEPAPPAKSELLGVPAGALSNLRRRRQLPQLDPHRFPP